MSSIKCHSCGLVNFRDALACKRCGAEFAPPESEPAAAHAEPEAHAATPTSPPSITSPRSADESHASQASGFADARGALRACAVCRMPYDQSAERCPHCGHVIAGKSLARVRRVAFALVPVFLVLALFAAWRYYSVKAAESRLAEQYGIVDTTVRPEEQKPWFWGIFRSQPTAEEILEHNAEVCGGSKALRAVESARMSGEFFIVDRSTEASARNVQASGKLFVQAKAPDLVAAELEFNGVGPGWGHGVARARRAFDGSRGWEHLTHYSTVPVTGEPLWRSEVHELTGTELEQTRRQADAVGLSTLKDRYKSVTLAGTEKVGKYVSSGDEALARAAYKVRGVNRDGKAETLYFDIESGLLTRADFTSESGGETTPVECYLEDYRKVGDVRVPFTLIYKVKQLIVTVRFNDINLNAEVANSTFAMPVF